MTTFEPGRIYSGIVDGKRRLLTLAQKEVWYVLTPEIPEEVSYTRCFPVSTLGSPTDVRGPLVVLDLDGVDVEYAVKMMRECGCDVNVIADQIEEQTRPPLQVGVHLAWSRSEGRRAYMCWDGNFWWYSDSNKSLADWESVHYVGPASGDSDD